MKTAILIFSSLLILVLSGCKGDEFSSKWRNADLTIDGIDSDWGNSLTYVKDSKFLFGVQNDDNYLFLCLVTNDQELENKIIRMGLTVWLDREGGDRKVFGLKYPLNFQDLGITQFERPQEGTDTQPRDRTQINERMLDRQTDVEIVGKNKDDVTRIPISELKGMKVKMGIKDYRLVYEMKIPLHPTDNAPYTINADTGNTISVGFTTGTIDRSKFQGRGFDRRREGETGEFGTEEGVNDRGGEGEYRRRPGNMNNGSNSEPLEYWAEVKLASHNR